MSVVRELPGPPDQMHTRADLRHCLLCLSSSITCADVHTTKADAAAVVGSTTLCCCSRGAAAASASTDAILVL